MGAAVISLAEVREQKQRAEERQHLHACFDRWLDTLETHMKTPKPTLEELTHAVWECRQELTGQLSATLLEQHFAAEQAQRQAPCPQCGHEVEARAVPTRIVETLVGKVEVARPYFYCVPCGRGFAPLEAVLGLAAGRKQFDLQRAAAKLTAEVPYETARELFADLTGVSLGTERLHTVTNAVAEDLGVLDVAPTRAEIEAQLAAVATGQRRRPILVLALDGAYVPLRPEAARGSRPGRKTQRAKRAHWQGEWHEAKGFRCYLVAGDRIVHLLSWHQVQSQEEVFAALEQVKTAGLIPQEHVRLCVLADGASWIWQRLTQLFPTARQILDYYHCAQYLHRVAALQYSEESAQAQEWAEALMARLFVGEVARVLRDLQHLQPTSDAAAAALANLQEYLDTHRHRLPTGYQRRGGYPLGSGGIEAAHKFIAHVRLKRSGAWWYQATSNHMLALRCAKYNGTYERVFGRYRQRMLTKSQRKHLKN
jgi:Uncharacterised protein family (UPF0236)